MSGCIATHLATRQHGYNINRVILLGPAGLSKIPFPHNIILDTPVLNKFMVKRDLSKENKDTSSGDSLRDAVLEIKRISSEQQPHFAHVVLDCFRRMSLEKQEEDYNQLKKDNTTIILGENDKKVKPEEFKR